MTFCGEGVASTITDFTPGEESIEIGFQNTVPALTLVAANGGADTFVHLDGVTHFILLGVPVASLGPLDVRLHND